MAAIRQRPLLCWLFHRWDWTTDVQRLQSGWFLEVSTVTCRRCGETHRYSEAHPGPGTTAVTR